MNFDEIATRIAAGVSERAACGDNKTRAAFRRWKVSKPRAARGESRRGVVAVPDCQLEQELAEAWDGWQGLPMAKKRILTSMYSAALSCGESSQNFQACKMFAKAFFPVQFIEGQQKNDKSVVVEYLEDLIHESFAREQQPETK